jgi:peptidoglycan/xylan/chitin deacetylase (PgdA/CDA1 family)
VPSLLRSFAATSPVLPLLRGLTWRFGRVLMYHRVVDDNCDPIVRGLLEGAITRTTFRRQLDYLARYYRVIALRAILGKPTGVRGGVAITFDDGYADNLYNALPLLEERRMPATVFVVAGLVNGVRDFWGDRLARAIAANGPRPLHLETGHEIRKFPFAGSYREQKRAAKRWLETLREEHRDAALNGIGEHEADRLLMGDELRRLERSGVEIQAHTLTHARLSCLERSAAIDELVQCKSILEHLLGKEIDMLAYPFGQRGDFTEETKRLARQAGYRVALAAFGGVIRADADWFAIPRIGTCEDFDHFRVKLARPYPVPQTLDPYAHATA